MSKTPTRATVPSFAGLRALTPFGRRAENDQPDEEKEDEEARTGRRAEEDKRREDEDARRAEEDKTRDEEDARRAEEDGGNGEDKDKGKGPKGRNDARKGRAEDDEECDEEDDPDAKVASAARSGRVAERARWINALNDAAMNPAHAGAACIMLATTDMHSSDVVAAVKALPAPAASRGGLRERMAAAEIPNVGAGGVRSAGGDGDFAAQMQAAVRKARPE